MAKLGESRNLPKKLVDTWTYKVKDVEIERLDYVPCDEDERVGGVDERDEADKTKLRKERIRNKLVTVNVYMDKQTEQSEEPPHPLHSVALKVECPELNLRLEGTDIVALKEAMWSMLDDKFAITWEEYYLVEVNRTRVYGGDGTGLEITYDNVYKGTTFDGKNLLKQWKGHDYRISVWPGAFKDEHGKVKACIPANEDNRKALKEFCRRVDVLREKLAEFLRPEVIMENLANLSGFSLLPPAPPQPKQPRQIEAGVVEAEEA